MSGTSDITHLRYSVGITYLRYCAWHLRYYAPQILRVAHLRYYAEYFAEKPQAAEHLTRASYASMPEP